MMPPESLRNSGTSTTLLARECPNTPSIIVVLAGQIHPLSPSKLRQVAGGIFLIRVRASLPTASADAGPEAARRRPHRAKGSNSWTMVSSSPSYSVAGITPIVPSPARKMTIETIRVEARLRAKAWASTSDISGSRSGGGDHPRSTGARWVWSRPRSPWRPEPEGPHARVADPLAGLIVEGRD